MTALALPLAWLPAPRGPEKGGTAKDSGGEQEEAAINIAVVREFARIVLPLPEMKNMKPVESIGRRRWIGRTVTLKTRGGAGRGGGLQRSAPAPSTRSLMLNLHQGSI